MTKTHALLLVIVKESFKIVFYLNNIDIYERIRIY